MNKNVMKYMYKYKVQNDETSQTTEANTQDVNIQSEKSINAVIEEINRLEEELKNERERVKQEENKEVAQRDPKEILQTISDNIRKQIDKKIKI